MKCLLGLITRNHNSKTPAVESSTSKDEITCPTLIGRGIPVSQLEIIKTDEGEKLKARTKAFYFRGKPEDPKEDGWLFIGKYDLWVEEGISVARGDLEPFEDTLKHDFLQNSEAIFTLHTGWTRSLGLQVVPQPRPNNLAHAEVRGLLPPTNLKNQDVFVSDEEHIAAVGNAFRLSEWARFSTCRTTYDNLITQVKDGKKKRKSR